MTIHKSVLLNEAIGGLNLKSGDIFFDGTLGGGGHSQKVCELFGKSVKIIGVDKDSQAVKRATEKFETLDCDFNFQTASFRNIGEVLDNLNLKEVNGILLDLGLSSDQIEDSSRGFSFQKDEPLIMTFSKEYENGTTTAQTVINEWSEETLADILFGYADERYARKIAKKIAEVRRIKPIEKTFELVEIIKSAVPVGYRKGRIHFATKTFQAIRIAVNDELEALKEGLAESFEKLARGGRMAIISFHSGEDRIVKNFFKNKKAVSGGFIATKKPIIASEEELARNPRARSAKLRIFEKSTAPILNFEHLKI
ncbi:MAG: 16S rRNA (cytosine(1402)-N(4))-methyltransferase RsmH [Patescibacteria group bacterium]|nr:16S rRNA (cytosine(1402)-N(4))-methyltransferase RsmH [Patescibacteria group bacterium]MDE1988168.1 16S rRNA (cytosine(1402)-N(4))-methyltransferase RsmH [Patescibacteria group bacterium]MDE2217988.1 16S rRNA (cytosine(1402)-N(4))-methyltransferase RsmH [Patescibacteria group bacterium]